MNTRAIPVVVERSPGGGNGFFTRIGERGRFLFGTSTEALGWTVMGLRRLGASEDEASRVTRLLTRELGRARRAEITAEVLR